MDSFHEVNMKILNGAHGVTTVSDEVTNGAARGCALGGALWKTITMA